MTDLIDVPARAPEAPEVPLDQLPFGELAARVDALRDRVNHSDEHVRALLEQTIDAVTAFNRAGVVTLVRMLREDPTACDVLYRAMDRPEVMALLVSHDIVHAGRALDVLRVVEQIRPHLVASGLDVEVVSVADDTVTLQFTGACGSSTAELRDGVREVLLARVPGLREVREAGGATGGGGPAFIPLSTLSVGR